MNIESVKNKIGDALKKEVKNLVGEERDFSLEFTTELFHGDVSSNLAMVLAKDLGRSPMDIAKDLIKALDGKIKGVECIDAAAPGFVNFHFAGDLVYKEVAEVLKKKDKYGLSDAYKDKKVLVEHSSPNLFKPFHIGHLMNNTIGESLVRLAQVGAGNVNKISYPSDVSLGIGKAVWALLEKGPEKLDSMNEEEQLAFLGECYVEGTKKYEEDESIQPRVREITTMLFEKTAGPELDAYKKGKEINIKYFENITKELGTEFDEYIYESEAGMEGKKLVKSHMDKVFEESDDAIIYPGEKAGLHTRVFINKDGYPTYEAKDIGLLALKFKKFSPDLSFTVTDHEQAEYFKVIFSAAGEIKKEWKEKSRHVPHGRMSFKGAKMSSRLGNTPLAKDILNTVKDEVRDKSDRLNGDDDIKKVAVGAIKFAILRVQAGKNINFDPEVSLSFEGDSGPYLQYTYARCKSLLAKGSELGIKPKVDADAELTDLSRTLVRFPGVLEKAVSSLQPHVIASYLLELARTFNSFYGNTKILDEGNKASSHNLAQAGAVSEVVRTGLWALGIETLEQM